MPRDMGDEREEAGAASGDDCDWDHEDDPMMVGEASGAEGGSSEEESGESDEEGDEDEEDLDEEELLHRQQVR